MRLRHVYTIGLLSVFFAGCAGKWVRHPEADAVKKVAIVSLFSSREIKGDRGSKAAGSQQGALAKIGGHEDPEDDWRIRLVAYTGDAYADSFQKLGSTGSPSGRRRRPRAYVESNSTPNPREAVFSTAP